MGRKLTGSVRFSRGRWYPRLKGEHFGGYESEDEACVVLEEALKEHSRLTAGAKTLRSIAREFFEERELRGVAGVQRELSVWASRVERSPLAQLPIKSIRPRDVSAFIKQVEKSKKLRATRRKVDGEWVVTTAEIAGRISRQTVANAFKIVQAALDCAVSTGIIDDNPARKVGLARQRSQTSVESGQLTPFLSLEEIENVIAVAGANGALYTVAIYSGLRKGELLGLKWQDIILDGDRPHIRVRRTYNRATKSKTSRRDVPLIERARLALIAHRVELGVTRATGPVFPGRGGAARTAADKLAWPAIRKRSGVGTQWRFHDLRHTCASHLLMGSWGPIPRMEQLRDFLGHSSIQMTEHYAHLAPGSISDVIRGSGSGKGNSGALRTVTR